MKLLYIFIFMVPLNSWALLCEPTVSPNNPRQVEIEFPGRTISLIGHVHPTREKEISIEPILWLLGAASPSEQSLPAEMQEKFRTTLRKLMEKSRKAQIHWREDLKTLRSMIHQNQVQNVNIEYVQENFRHAEENYEIQFNNLTRNLKNLGFDEHEVKTALLFALTPGFFLKATEPKVFGEVRMSTVEPVQAEADEFDLKYCSKTPDPMSTPARKKAIDKFIASCTFRGILGILKTRISDGLKGAYDLATERIRLRKPVNELELAERFDQITQLQLSYFEKKQLATYLEGYIEVGRDNLRPQKSFFRDIEAGWGHLQNFIDQTTQPHCWGRNALMAKNLAQQEGNSVLFIGAGHLIDLAAYLKQECRKSFTQSPNSPRQLEPRGAMK